MKIGNESVEQVVVRLVRLENKIDDTIRQLREERKREQAILKQVLTLLENSTVLYPQKKYLQVIEDDAGYIKELLEIKKIIEYVAYPDIEGGYHKLVDNKIVVDEERKRLIEEMSI